MTTSVALWPLDRLVAAIEEARQVEIACKQTGARPELLVRALCQRTCPSIAGPGARARLMAAGSAPAQATAIAVR